MRKQKHNLNNDTDECKTAAVNDTLRRGTTCYESYDSSLKVEVGVERRDGGEWEVVRKSFSENVTLRLRSES